VPSQRRVEVGLLRGLLLLVCGVLLASSVYAAGTSAGWAPPFAVVCTASCVALTVALSPRGWLSGSSVYAAMFFAFHCGILLPLALGLPVPFLNEQDAQWADGPALRSAAGLAALAVSALLLSQVLVGGRRAVSDRNQSPGPVDPPPLGLVGMPLLTLGVLGWVAIVLSRGGVGLAFGGYGDFLAATQGSATTYAYLCIGVGMAFAAASSSTRTRRVSLVLFAVWAVPAALLGLRGEVLLPGLAYLVVLHRRQPLRFRPSYAAVGLAVLSLGSVIRVERNVGVLAGRGWHWSAFNPLPGLVEMGYSIRPVVEVWHWSVYGHESHVGYGTYVAPFQRLDTTVDPRNFSGVVADRVGPIGGSPVAEAFRAHGMVGVVVVMLLIGLALVAVDRLPGGSLSDAVVGGVIYVLLLWLRNDFTPVPFALLAIAGLAGVSVSLSLLLARARPYVRTPAVSACTG